MRPLTAAKTTILCDQVGLIGGNWADIMAMLKVCYNKLHKYHN